MTSKQHGRSRGAVVAALLIVLNVATLGRSSELVVGRSAQAKNGMVSSVSEPASRIGASVLKRGGNAVDAAVATAFALAVTYPEAGNIGGGGFMVVHRPQQKPVVIDYREVAPQTARQEVFQRLSDCLNHKAVGVPGTVRGLALAHRKFGKLPWKELVTPAAELAQGGLIVDEELARSLNEYLPKSRQFAEFQRVFGKPDGSPWRPGDRLVQADLGKTLHQIAVEGPSAFYEGRIAELLVAEMRRGEGLISRADLAAYRAKTREARHTTFRGYDIYCSPAPTGGDVLIEMLNILENFDLKSKGRWSAETVHLMIETMRLAFLDRATYLGDPDFVEIPARLTGKKYAAKLARQIDPSTAGDSEALAQGRSIHIAPEPTDTTHFSVIDAQGMAVSNTYTIEQRYGSRIVVQGAGFLLNNEMGDFGWRPGHTDRSGAIGTRPNLIEPGKRMLSSQTPTIVSRDGRVVLITGSPGGRSIINTVLQVVLNVLEFEMDLQSAVDAPRFHHQWLPDRVVFEHSAKPKHADLIRAVTDRGHKLGPFADYQGDANNIWVDPKTGLYHGVADQRRGGAAAGY